MTAAQQPTLALATTKTARGRKDAEGTEVVIKTKPLRDALTDLLSLKAAATAAKDELNDAIKGVAERTGLLSSVVRRLVNAKAGDDFSEEARKVEQLALVFDEFGDVPKN